MARRPIVDDEQDTDIDSRSLLAFLDRGWDRLRVVSVYCVVTVFVLVRNGVGLDGLSRPFVDELVPALPHFPPWVPLYQFLFSSSVGAINARLLGIGSLGPYVALHIAVLLGGLGGLAAIINRNFGALAAKTTLALFAASQVPTMLLQRLGGYDAYAIVFGGLAATGALGPWAFLVGVGWSAAGFEQAVIACTGLLAILKLTGRPLRPIVITFAGVATGRAAMEVWLRSEGVNGSRADWIAHYGVQTFLDMFVEGLPWLVITGAGAVPIFAYLHLRGAAPATRTSVGCAWLVALLIPFLTVALVDDEGRVLAAIQWPMVVCLALVAASALPAQRLVSMSVRTLLISLIVPPLLVSHGKLYLAPTHLLRALPFI